MVKKMMRHGLTPIQVFLFGEILPGGNKPLFRNQLELTKKIADLKTENVLRRFKEKSFAKGVHREEILLCEKDRLTLEEFISLGIQALQKESEAIGL